MLPISTLIHDSILKLLSFMKRGKGVDTNPQDKTSYTTQYHEATLKYLKNENRAKHRHLPVPMSEKTLNNPLSSLAMVCRSVQSSNDLYNLSRDDKEYLMANSVAKMTPGWTYHASPLLTAGWFNLISSCELRLNWWQRNPNLNHYHSDPMEISSICSLPDIADRWGQQKETNSTYTNVSIGTCTIFSIIPHWVSVEASVSLGRNMIGCQQS